MRSEPQNSHQLGLIYTPDRVCNPYGNPGTHGSHRGRVPSDGAAAHGLGAPHTHGPLSRSCLTLATAAAVATSSTQPSSNLTQMQPDSLTWGWLRRALPPVLLRSMAYLQKPTWETQLHNPKRLGVNTYGAAPV